MTTRAISPMSIAIARCTAAVDALTWTDPRQLRPVARVERLVTLLEVSSRLDSILAGSPRRWGSAGCRCPTAMRMWAARPPVLGTLISMYDETCYAIDVALPISVRLDDEAERALRLLESTGLSRSAAIRSALIASAEQVRSRAALAAEVEALEADEADRSEMTEVAELMESLRAPG